MPGELHETLQILEKVHAFYSSAFSQLITITGGALAFVGVLVPWFISWQQEKRFKAEQAAQEAVIRQALEDAREKLTENLERQLTAVRDEANAMIAQRHEETQKELGRIRAEANAGAFHVQAQRQEDNELWRMAFLSAITAAESYALARDEMNLTAALTIALRAIAKVDSNDLEGREDEIDEALSALYGQLESLSSGNGRYSRNISELKREVAKAKKRPKPGKTMPSEA